MIVELAEMACKQLNELDSLQNAKAEAADIHATLKELAEVKTKSSQVDTLCSLLGKRLPLRDIQSEDISKFLQDVQTSHTKFVNERARRQVQPLRNISANLQKLLDRIETEWKTHAGKLVQPYFELLEVVGSLPEVREQEVTLNGLKNALQRHIAILPRSSDELADFDIKFEQLKRRLANLENLHPEVKSFLRKAYNHQATVADLTDEVIRWCRQGEHAKVFRISFVS